MGLQRVGHDLVAEQQQSFSSLFKSCRLLLVPLMAESEREQLAKPSVNKVEERRGAWS